MNKQIRWQERLTNLTKASEQLSKGIAIQKPSDIEQQGIIQSFEFTFELCWKTLKDYLESQGVLTQFPRDVIKKSFHHELIEDGEAWMQMLEDRNLLAHTCNEELANEAYKKIKNNYYQALLQVYEKLKSLK